MMDDSKLLTMWNDSVEKNGKNLGKKNQKKKQSFEHRDLCSSTLDVVGFEPTTFSTQGIHLAR